MEYWFFLLVVCPIMWVFRAIFMPLPKANADELNTAEKEESNGMIIVFTILWIIGGWLIWPYLPY